MLYRGKVSNFTEQTTVFYITAVSNSEEIIQICDIDLSFRRAVGHASDISSH